MRIKANRRKGKFGHMGFSDDDHTRITQTTHNRCILFRRRRIATNEGTCKRWLSGNIEEVLDRNDAPVERTDNPALPPARVGSIRLSTCLPRIDLAENTLIL